MPGSLAAPGGSAMRSLIFATTACVAFASAAGAGATRQFSAGAAKTDITPELGTMLVGSTNPRPALHVHDPLHARALVLNDGQTRLAFVICDLIGVPAEIVVEAKRIIAERTRIPASHVTIAGTHTHTAGSPYSPGLTTPDRSMPNTPPGPYQLFAARRIADAVQTATNNLEPAKIGWGVGNEPSEVFNRRWYMKSESQLKNPFGGLDKVQMNPPGSDAIRPAGPTDPEIVFISVQALDGRPIGLLANYSLHYVGGVPESHISADYYGAFAVRIGALLGARAGGPPFVGIMSNGTSGDVNNSDIKGKRLPRVPYEKMQLVANRVAAEVYRAYQNVEHRAWVPLDARYVDATIGSRKPTPEMVERARTVLARPAGAKAWHPREASYAKRVLELERAPATVQAPLQAFRVGDLGIVTFPAEVFAEIGLEIKATSPFAKTFALSLANSYFGYLPSVAQHQLGGYETWIGTNRLEVEAAPKMTAVLLGFLKEMHQVGRRE